MDGARLIVGLGNPGEKYVRTRHNVGFQFIEHLANDNVAPLRRRQKFSANVAQIEISGVSVWLLQPLTFVNRSGDSVVQFAKYYKIDCPEIIVVHDDIDLPAGTVRLKMSGGHGGHNGIRDLISKLNANNFVRIRLGVGRPPPRVSSTSYVLGVPPADETLLIQQATDAAQQELRAIIKGDTEAAMHVLHSRPVPQNPI